MAAAESFERAVSLDGSDPNTAHNMALYLLMPLGRLQAAHEQAAHILALAPAWNASFVLLAYAARIGGDLSEAERRTNDAMALGFAGDRPPVCVIRSELALRDRRVDEAVALMLPALAPALRNAGGGEVCAIVYDALLGRRPATEAVTALDRISGALATDIPSVDCTGNAGLFMDWYVQLGAIERAFSVAERIVAERQAQRPHDIFSLLTLWRPRFAPFREHPRFASLVGRLGMMVYWERHGPPDGYTLRSGKLSLL